MHIWITLTFLLFFLLRQSVNKSLSCILILLWSLWLSKELTYSFLEIIIGRVLDTNVSTLISDPPLLESTFIVWPDVQSSLKATHLLSWNYVTSGLSTNKINRTRKWNSTRIAAILNLHHQYCTALHIDNFGCKQTWKKYFYYASSIKNKD